MVFAVALPKSRNDESAFFDPFQRELESDTALDGLQSTAFVVYTSELISYDQFALKFCFRRLTPSPLLETPSLTKLRSPTLTGIPLNLPVCPFPTPEIEPHPIV